MTFGGLKETSESMENNEAKTENTEKKRNQILEIPDEYKDDFDKKIETSEIKSNRRILKKRIHQRGEKKPDGLKKSKVFFQKKRKITLKKKMSQKRAKSRINTAHLLIH